MDKVTKEFTNAVTDAFLDGLKTGFSVIFSPFRFIANSKSGKDYEYKAYLSVSDDEKKYNDWKNVDNDLRKVIHNYGQ